MLIHIMKDGTVRESVEGIKIQSEQFYQILFEIQKKCKRKNDKNTRCGGFAYVK